MAGFFLYVSNTTSKKDGHLCFHEIQTAPGTPLPDQKINCSVLGRYVIYYNDRLPNITYPSYYSQSAFNELCEVEVYTFFVAVLFVLLCFVLFCLIWRKGEIKNKRNTGIHATFL